MITDEDMLLAIDRIARTDDGLLLYEYLRKELMGVVEVVPDAAAGALLLDHGRRKFALKLMAVMNKGIQESAGSSPDPTRRPVTFAIAAVAAAGKPSRGAQRRVTWDPAADGFPNGGAGTS